MSCEFPYPVYTPAMQKGIKLIGNIGDGKSMSVAWNEAFPTLPGYYIGYNIYYSSIKDDIIKEGPKFVSINPLYTSVITDFTPPFNAVNFTTGQVYYFVVRAFEYDPLWYNLSLLPQDVTQNDSDLFVYPETLLSANIDDTTLIIPISDASIFPAYGIIQIGYELIRYTGKNLMNNTLLASDRGFFGTNARLHEVNGWDSVLQQDPTVKFFKGFEEDNLFIVQEQCRFTRPNEVFTEADGYRDINREGVLTLNNTVSDAHLMKSPYYDMVGWHRQSPIAMFTGQALDSYFGGESWCADGSNGSVNHQIRNISFEAQALRREEFLLTEIGTADNCCLLSRIWNGITCNCYEINQEQPDSRCDICYGTGFVGGYQQYLNTRQSDRKIPVRFGPVNEDLKRNQPGLENSVIFDCWTLGSWTLKDSDVLIRYNLDNTEEFRYEILDVVRNKLLFAQFGNQHFKAQRIVKTDIIYTWKNVSSTSYQPTILQTTVGLLRGPNGSMIPHVHDIIINENISSVSQITQTTSQAVGHNHTIITGVVQNSLSHQHGIILP